MTYTTPRVIKSGPGKFELAVATYQEGATVFFSVWSTRRWILLTAHISSSTELNESKDCWRLKGTVTYHGIKSEWFEATYYTAMDGCKSRGNLSLAFNSDEELDMSELALLIGCFRVGKRVRTCHVDDETDMSKRYPNRKNNALGSIIATAPIPNYTDHWQIRHDDGSVAIYHECELILLPK